MTFAILLTPSFMLLWGFDWYLLISGIVIAAFFLDMMLGTKYTIDGNNLYLRAGCLFHSKIDIQKIISIKHQKTCTNDNSFAWSTDRLMLKMPRGYKYQVSPTDEQRFIEALKEINPNITLE